MFEELPEYPPVLQETLNSIDTMSKKELKEFSKSLLLNFADLLEKHSELQKQYNNKSTDYLSRCRTSGGVTLPPGV